MPTIMLSDTALSLLRLNITGPYVAVTAGTVKPTANWPLPG